MSSELTCQIEGGRGEWGLCLAQRDGLGPESGRNGAEQLQQLLERLSCVLVQCVGVSGEGREDCVHDVLQDISSIHGPVRMFLNVDKRLITDSWE